MVPIEFKNRIRYSKVDKHAAQQHRVKKKL
jgi:hypothetical protein